MSQGHCKAWGSEEGAGALWVMVREGQSHVGGPSNAIGRDRMRSAWLPPSQIANLGVVAVTGTGPGGHEKAFSLDMPPERFSHEAGAGSSVAPAEEGKGRWVLADVFLLREVKTTVLPFRVFKS